MRGRLSRGRALARPRAVSVSRRYVSAPATRPQRIHCASAPRAELRRLRASRQIGVVEQTSKRSPFGELPPMAPGLPGVSGCRPPDPARARGHLARGDREASSTHATCEHCRPELTPSRRAPSSRHSPRRLRTSRSGRRHRADHLDISEGMRAAAPELDRHGVPNSRLAFSSVPTLLGRAQASPTTPARIRRRRRPSCRYRRVFSRRLCSNRSARSGLARACRRRQVSLRPSHSSSRART